MHALGIVTESWEAPACSGTLTLKGGPAGPLTTVAESSRNLGSGMLSVASVASKLVLVVIANVERPTLPVAAGTPGVMLVPKVV
jgi:hypothetical protein